MIALAMLIGSFGWCAFLLPHHITIGGIAGIASVIQWGLDIPVQYTYLTINGILLFVALKILGWKFCVRTIFAVLVFAFSTSVLREVFAGHPLFSDEPFLACVVGGVLLGVGVSIALQYNASSGGSDVIAAMIHKYRDVSLGRVILACDLCIISSSYLVLENWEKVIYGYIVLFVHWGEIGSAINNDVDRGCTVIEARGFYTGKKVGMLFVIARRSEAHSIYQVIDEIDPNAFVSQGAVNGVYGMGFDRMKVAHKKKTADDKVRTKE